MFPSGNITSHWCNENPNSKQEGLEPSFLLEFPSPFLDDNNDMFLRTNTVPESETNTKKISEKTPVKATTTKRRKSGKKDRHSKIYTAQGLRDRRMRLSVQISRKFFDLQDMLGFDKASKTIEWLFAKSKKAIKEVTGNIPQINNNPSGGAKSESFTSDYEVESWTEMGTASNTFPGGEKRCTKLHKTRYDPVPRESREKARARARERTREKMMIKHLQKCWFEGNPYNVDQLGFTNVNFQQNLGYFETGEEESRMNYCSQEKKSPYEASSHSVTHQLANVQIFEKFLGTKSSNDAVSGGIYSNNFLCSLGNWDVDSARINSIVNCGIIPQTGNFFGQNTSSNVMATSNIHPQHQER